ncbi:MAG: Gfo/Idh/MocA family oxidoreductase [Bacteroidota bacterium]|nr:Gfo/Idh/MocA family oxidoreductase [Bacteroidota bacterium]
MNLGILGVGSFGKKHINVLKNIQGIKIIGFYDPDKKKSIEVEKKFKIKSFKSDVDLIKNCDAIDIVTNTRTHHHLIKLCIKHDKHIFVEKPICCTQDEVDDLKHYGQSYKKIIQVGHIERYNPVSNIYELENTNFIEINSYRTGILSQRNKKNSIILDLMIHDIDFILNIVRSDIESISSRKDNKEGDEYVESIIIFKNKKIAKLTSERGVNKNSYRVTKVIYKDKLIELDFLNRKVNLLESNQLKKIIETDDKINPLESELTEFYNNVLKNKKPKVSLFDGCRAVEIALKIEKKLNNNIL